MKSSGNMEFKSKAGPFLRTHSKKDSLSTRKANAAGFAKRHSRKAQATSKVGTSSDVYEYSSGKNKRSAITLSLDKDEATILGGGIEDGELDHDTLRARIMNTDGDAVVNSEDDEEIDSDDAFEESDEDRYAGFSFAKKPSSNRKMTKSVASRPAVRVAIDLNEDEHEDDDGQKSEDEEASGDSDEFLDVLDVLDGRGEPDFGEDEREGDGVNPDGNDEGVDVDKEDVDEGDDGEEHDDEEDGDEEMADPSALSDSADEEIDGAALDHLGAFVSQLEPGKKRKATDDSEGVLVNDGAPPTRKRRILKERTEAGVEGEFGVHAAPGSKLQLDDLLAPLASTSSSLLALKKSTKPLKKGDALPAPLPQRTQDRLDREAAYEQTKEEVDKWKATMKRIKEAEHLSFPLQVPQKINPSNSELAAKFKPSTELESAIDNLLKAGQMRDEGDIAKTEELKMNHLSVEEVAERRAELRTMRELMFRAEAKAKRVAKIKSKTYRKIQKKSRERVKGLIKEAEQADSEDDGEEERMKREVERARERATLRHKNTGKWAKAMKTRSELEVDQRQAIEEMLDKGERLRAQIQGGGGSEEDDDDDEAENDIEGIKASAFEELQRLDREDADTPRAEAKGVFGMKFMQDAMAREASRVGGAADDFRDEMTRIQGGSDEEVIDEEDPPPGPSRPQVQRMGGRMVFRPGQATVSPWSVAPSDSSSTLKSSEPALLSPMVSSQPTVRVSSPVPPDDFVSLAPPHAEICTDNPESNPWLLPQNSAPTQSRKKNEVIVGKDSASEAKSKNVMKKRLMKGEEERVRARDDAVVEISLEEVLKLPNDPSAVEDSAEQVKSRKAKGKAQAAPNGHQVDAAFEESDENSELEAQEHSIKTKGKGKGIKAFQQRDLVALAFAGDNVVQDFEKLKQREVAADAPREEDHTLPGWGSWGGSGVRRNPKARMVIKKVAGIDPTSRADHGKPHLIISEKKDKKAAKYLTKDLPYPYTSKAQFEKSMEVPIGTEWNTRVGFQRQTLPRVVKKMGTVIDPLEKMF